MSEASKDLLLEDYRYRAESLWKNEQGGETRVNLFIGLLTLVGGLMASLLTKENQLIQGESVRFVVLAGIFSLLALGTVTMLRMLTRNKNTDEAKHALDIIRQTIKDHFDDDAILLHYYPFGPPGLSKKTPNAKKEQQEEKENQKRSGKTRGFGGLSHTMATLNSLLFAAFVAVLLHPFILGDEGIVGTTQTELMPILISALLAFALGLGLQVWYIDYRETRAKQIFEKGDPTHAGGIVFRRVGRQIEYLLVRSNTTAEEWVLPHGHIEGREGHVETAVREVREESGVYVHPIRLVDRVRFPSKKEKFKDVKYYLMELIHEEPSPEDREKLWLQLEEAIHQLTYPESRYLVHAAEQIRLAKENQTR